MKMLETSAETKLQLYMREWFREIGHLKVNVWMH